MDNLGDMFFGSFLRGIGIALAGLWTAMLTYPWLFAVLAFVVIGGLYLQIAPRRHRRRSR